MGKPLLNAIGPLGVTHSADSLVVGARENEVRIKRMIEAHLEHEAAARLDQRCIGCANAKVHAMIDDDYKTMRPKIHGWLKCDRAPGGCHHEVAERMKTAWDSVDPFTNEVTLHGVPREVFEREYMTHLPVVNPDVPENSSGAW
jgi:hypothetical protein